MHCRKEICWTCLFKASILALPFWNSKHSIPTRSFRFLRAAVPSSSSALRLHHAHPFVAAAEKNVCHAEKQRVLSWICGMEDLLQYTDCAPMWLLQTKLLASVGWKRGCEHFGCRCSQHVTHCHCVMQRSRGFCHGVVVSKFCYNTVIVLSVVLCDCCKPTNNCWDSDFSNSELDVWLPAF